jgi:hypothetical protein
VVIFYLAIRGDQESPLGSARPAPHLLAMTSGRPVKCLSLHSKYFSYFRLVTFQLKFPLLLDFCRYSPSPKRIRGIVDEEIGDDTAKGQSVPTFAVDPSSGTTEASLEHSPAPADHSLRVTIAVAPSGPTPPSTGEPTTTSTLGTSTRCPEYSGRKY